MIGSSLVPTRWWGSGGSVALLAVAGWLALFAPDRRVDVLSLALPLVLLRLFDLVALSDVKVIVTKFVKITKVLIRRVDSN